MGSPLVFRRKWMVLLQKGSDDGSADRHFLLCFRHGFTPFVHIIKHFTAYYKLLRLSSPFSYFISIHLRLRQRTWVQGYSVVASKPWRHFAKKSFDFQVHAFVTNNMGWDLFLECPSNNKNDSSIPSVRKWQFLQ